jgi:hypothetical protein
VLVGFSATQPQEKTHVYKEGHRTRMLKLLAEKSLTGFGSTARSAVPWKSLIDRRKVSLTKSKKKKGHVGGSQKWHGIYDDALSARDLFQIKKEQRNRSAKERSSARCALCCENIPDKIVWIILQTF